MIQSFKFSPVDERMETKVFKKVLSNLFDVLSSHLVCRMYHVHLQLKGSIQFISYKTRWSRPLCSMYLPNFCQRLDVKQGQFFKLNKAGLNSEFSFKISCLAERRTHGFMPLVQSELQTV